MSHIHRTALLPYSVERLFALVNDVAAYPEYMQGCEKAIVHEQNEDAMLATLYLAKGAIKMQFTTKNRLDKPKVIDMQLVDGPFDQFQGQWFFQYLNDDACKVVLDLQFSLNNKAVALAVKKLFDGIANHMVDAVIARAKHLYG